MFKRYYFLDILILVSLSTFIHSSMFAKCSKLANLFWLKFYLNAKKRYFFTRKPTIVAFIRMAKRYTLRAFMVWAHHGSPQVWWGPPQNDIRFYRGIEAMLFRDHFRFIAVTAVSIIASTCAETSYVQNGGVYGGSGGPAPPRFNSGSARRGILFVLNSHMSLSLENRTWK